MKKIIRNVIGIGAAIAGVALIALFRDNNNAKYSDNWFNSTSDDELKIEREKVRQEFCTSGDNHSLAVGLQKLLWRFDDVMGKRAWNGSDAYRYPKHREHGWYLPNDD